MKGVSHRILLDAISEQKPQKEIMSQFGFKTSTQLKIAYLDAIIKEGIVPGLSKGKKKKKPNDKVKVNSRGTLIIPKHLVEFFGLKKEGAYEALNTGDGILLSYVEPKPKTILRKKPANNETAENHCSDFGKIRKCA